MDGSAWTPPKSSERRHWHQFFRESSELKLVGYNVEVRGPVSGGRLRSSSRERWEFYDMEADRTELNDLSAKFPERAKQMQSAWEKWAQEVGVGKKKGAK